MSRSRRARLVPASQAALVLTLLVGATGCGSEAHRTATRSPSPTGSISAPSAAPATPSPSPSPSTIAPSRPVELYFPTAHSSVPVAPEVCPVVGGMLDPDRRDLTVACYYVAPDKPYSAPGSSAPDVVVLAGHTWRDGPAAFNLLHDWRTQTFSVAAGDELWVRTEASAGSWLVYRARSFHTPAKDGGLANDAEIWGTGPMPGRLLTIGCQQRSEAGQGSTNNVVVVWQFERVAPHRPT